MQFTQQAAMVNRMLGQYVGKEATLVYLKAAHYNGLRCEIVDVDAPLDLSRCARLTVRVHVNGDRKLLQVKLRNVLFDEDIRDGDPLRTSYTGENLSPATFDEIVLASRLVVQHSGGGRRVDMKYRLDILRDWLAAVDGEEDGGNAGESKQTIAFPLISCQVRHKTQYAQLDPQMRILDSVQVSDFCDISWSQSIIHNVFQFLISLLFFSSRSALAAGTVKLI